MIIKVLHSLAPGGWINFTGTKFQWITSGADLQMYVGIWMSIQGYEHTNTHSVQRNKTERIATKELAFHDM